MPAMRSRRDIKRYKQYLKHAQPNTNCVFCAITQMHDQYVSETAHFKIIRNSFPYVMWDTQPVVEHLMLIPKKHTDTLVDLTAAESKEYIQTISEFEAQGYNIYARAPGSHMKSILHQHTHLIKVAPRGKLRIVIISRRPFIRIAR